MILSHILKSHCPSAFTIESRHREYFSECVLLEDEKAALENDSVVRMPYMYPLYVSLREYVYMYVVYVNVCIRMPLYVYTSWRMIPWCACLICMSYTYVYMHVVYVYVCIRMPLYVYTPWRMIP